tara:strand:+ start:5854 stop:7710 length:1857 start_codon:yes stop_codon:yes gene_type:complete
MSSIVGPKFLERLRSSDFKNSAYAIAEIVDNSIDAGADKVEILIDTVTAGRSEIIQSITFVDNGSGISHDLLKKVVVFSETGHNPGEGKTGRFGMGLPNSSLSQCKKFIVASEQSDNWRQIKIDLRDMLDKGTLDVPDVSDSLDDSLKRILNELTRIKQPKTCVHWVLPDKLDFTRGDTAVKRLEPMLGRIYRKALVGNLDLEIIIFKDGNSVGERHTVRPYDPLFLSLGDSQGADCIEKTISKSPHGDHPSKNPSDILGAFVSKGKLIKTPFREVEEYCHDNLGVTVQGKVYNFKVTTSVAKKDIQKPAMERPGKEPLGAEMRKKMLGSANFPGGNISFVRNGREIESGNYSLFNVSQETQRWWSIEVSYNTHGDDDNIYDELMGLSHTKQSIKFKAVPEDEYQSDFESDNLLVKRQVLFSYITKDLTSAIKRCNKILRDQAKEYKAELEVGFPDGPVDGPSVPTGTPTTTAVLIDALGRGAELTKDQKLELSKKLSKHLAAVPIENITYAVEKFSEIGIKNIPIYCSLDKGKLFEAQRFQGRHLTLINTNHSFYLKIIEPLKEKGEDSITASVELLLSALSREEMNGLESDEAVIESYVNRTSQSLTDLLRQQESR